MQLSRQDKMRSSWYYYWHRTFLHLTILFSTGTAWFVSLNEPRYVSRICTDHSPTKVGGYFLPWICLPPLPITSYHRYYVSSAYSNISHQQPSVSTPRTASTQV